MRLAHLLLSWSIAALLLLASMPVAAQNIGINANGATPNASAILDIDVSAVVGAKKGLLIPRITTVERNAIPTPATSLLIFNTTTNRFEYFDGLAWVPFIGGGTLDQAYDFGGAGLGRTITADAGTVTIAGTDGFVATGTFGSGAIAPAGAGTRMVWNPNKAAFRAGNVTGTQWDNASIGANSVAMGKNTMAIGSSTTAFGEGTGAVAPFSTAMGTLTSTLGLASTAMGSNNQAFGAFSTAMGENTTTLGTHSTSMGSFTAANGNASAAMGRDNTASSFGEVVLGVGATTYTTTALGDSRFRAANATDRLFVVGNAIDANNNDLVDVAERSDALVVLKNGNTGIGSSNPSARLHVVGNIRMVDGNQAVNRVMVSNAIGTATWTDPLTVAAALTWTLTGNAGTNQATNFLGTTDAQPLRFRVNNVFAGNIATTATGLVSLGLNAGAVNTALGATFLGSNSGATNTTGANNTFVGQNAGAANTTTSHNTYVGTNAGAANTTGAQNVYIGRLAGGSGTTGSDNILIGNGAGLTNTANNNVMVGSFAGNANSTGAGNTFMGSLTGSATTTGGQNTFIGTGAGTTNTTGAQNTLIGNGAAVSANNLTNAAAIGANAQVSAINAMVLGSINGVNGATASTNVGIGVTAPVAKLQIQSAATATKTLLTQGLLSAGHLITTDFTAGLYTPGLFWNTTNNNATKPKAGIFLQETNLGSFMYLGTSNNYTTGITNDGVVIDPDGDVGIGTVNPLDRLHVVGSMRMVDGNEAVNRVLVSDANGTASWQTLGAAATNAWGLTGNAGTNPATNFLGTTDAQPLRLRVGNALAGQLSNTATGVVSYGLGAGAVNTGASNTFMGSSAGSSNTTGNRKHLRWQGCGCGQHHWVRCYIHRIRCRGVVHRLDWRNVRGFRCWGPEYHWIRKHVHRRGCWGKQHDR